MASRATALCCAIVGFIACAGCADEGPASPDAPAAVAGSWSGIAVLTSEAGTSRNLTNVRVSATIAQSDRSATGQFTSNVLSGTFAAQVEGAQMTGTLTMQGSDGCTARAAMRGTLDGSELRLTVPSIGLGTCSWGAHVQITLTRV